MGDKPMDEVKTKPGIWEEIGGNTKLVILDIPAITPGMVVVAKIDEDWKSKPNLRWQTWPDQLVLTPDPNQH
jgi:hypothetical protein